MITVHGAPPTRALRVIWLLEEMGLPYRVRPVPLFTRERGPDFLQASPAGLVPAIEDGEVRMAESVAILEYLAARYGPTPLAPSADDPGFPLYLQFLHFGEASLAAPLNLAVATRFFAPEADKANWGTALALRMAVRRCEVLAAQLERTPFIAGEAFTAADISCAYGLHLMQQVGPWEKVPTRVLDYWDRVTARPAYLAAQECFVPLIPPR